MSICRLTMRLLSAAPSPMCSPIPTASMVRRRPTRSRASSTASAKRRSCAGPDGSPWIHSYAHGRTIYDLKYDAKAVRAAIDKS